MLLLEGVKVDQGGFVLHAGFDLDVGETLALIGPSGAGKSTLLSVIAGYIAPTMGRLSWAGTDITHSLPGQRPIAMLFQDNNHFPHLTVEQNVGLGIRPNLRLTTEDRFQVEQALDRVGLSGFGARKPGSLSGGQQSRAALARVLVQRKPLILLDEPFAALGPAMKNEMLDLVSDLVKEIAATLILVSHDPGDVKRIAALTSVVAENRVHAPLPTQDLFQTPPEALRAYLGSG